MAGIRILTPGSGDVFKRGESVLISWVPLAPTDDEVIITLRESTTSTLILTIDSTAPNDGICVWEIPEAIALRADYFIRIKEVGTAVTKDSSDFEIEEKSSFSDFDDLTEIDKVILCEIEVGISFEGVLWTVDSGTRYKVSAVGFSPGEIVRMEHNGISIRRCYSETFCLNNTNTFYYDGETGDIHINIGSDPNASGNFFMGFTWLGFTNRQDVGFPLTFEPPDSIYAVYYQPILDASSIPAITQRVAEYYTSALVTQFGSLKFLNNAWLWAVKPVYEWHNKRTIVRFGELSFDQNEYVIIFTGATRNLEWTDEVVTIGVKDERVSKLMEIPINRYSSATYPTMDMDYDNKPRPILIGTKTGIVVTLISAAAGAYVFKVSDTVFNSTFPLQSIDAVRQAEVRIYETDNYSVDLNAGTITLFEDPGDDVITVDAHGIKCGYDFLGTGSGITYKGEPTGVFSENVADILFFVLTELNNIPLSKIDVEAFYDLQTKRTQRLGWYLKSAMKTMDFVRLLQTSTVFHFIPNLSGSFTVRYYDRATPLDALHFYNDDYTDFQMMEDTDSAFKTVVVKYDKNPTEDTWLEVYGSTDLTEQKYGEKDTLTLETALLDSSEASALVSFYQGLVDEPTNKVSVTVPSQALQNIPSDKAFFSRSIVGDDGVPVQILEEEVYLLLDVRKKISDGSVSLVGLLDTQAGGMGSHGDTAHINTHLDESHNDHLDSAHVDIDHEDIPFHDDHIDIEYDDDHIDNPHLDHDDSHDDGIHINVHTDNPYDDYDDEVLYQNYTDIVDHEDVPHGDGYDDYNDITHGDEHGDSPHADSEV